MTPLLVAENQSVDAARQHRFVPVNEQLANWGAMLENSIAKRTWLWLSVWSFLYAINGWSRAVQKPFWFDELFTIVLSRLDPSTLWRALSHGADLNPPGIYLLTRLFHM